MTACRIFLILGGYSLKTAGVALMVYAAGCGVTAIGCAIQCGREGRGD